MVAGKHFESQNIAKSQQRFKRSQADFTCWLILVIWTAAAVKIL